VNLPQLCRSIRTAAQVSFSRSGGPGGQNVNKVNTKVTLHIRLIDLEGLSEAEAARLQIVLSSRITGTAAGSVGVPSAKSGGAASTGTLVIASSEERSQKINLERAYARAEALIANAARLPKKRRPVKPSKAAKERRLRAKQQHSEKKANRLSPCAKLDP
jgi:ribosome-associated protein